MEKRQQKWQEAKRKQGLCSCCGKRPLAQNSKWFCAGCLAFKYSRRKNKKEG